MESAEARTGRTLAAYLPGAWHACPAAARAGRASDTAGWTQDAQPSGTCGTFQTKKD